MHTFTFHGQIHCCDSLLIVLELQLTTLRNINYFLSQKSWNQTQRKLKITETQNLPWTRRCACVAIEAGRALGWERARLVIFLLLSVLPHFLRHVGPWPDASHAGPADGDVEEWWVGSVCSVSQASVGGEGRRGQAEWLRQWWRGRERKRKRGKRNLRRTPLAARASSPSSSAGSVGSRVFQCCPACRLTQLWRRSGGDYPRPASQGSRVVKGRRHRGSV